MSRVFIPVLGCLLLSGCATRTGDKASAPPARADTAIPSPYGVVGHVIAVDMNTRNVVIDVSPFAVLPFGFSGRIMLARTGDLRPSAKLQASPYLRGHILGAKLLTGRPNEGDEVVIPPETR